MEKALRLWVTELGLSIGNFQWAAEKMANLNIKWVGVTKLKESTFTHCCDTLLECTFEFGSEVRAIIVLGKTDRAGNFPLLHNDKLYLTLFRENFIVIVEYDYLNVAELIFLIDNDKRSATDLMIPANILDLF